MTNYEKPRMEFTALQSEKAVAAPCWPGSKTNEMDLYYNTSGPGYVRIHFYNDGATCNNTRSHEVYFIGNVQDRTAAFNEAEQAIASHTTKPNPFKNWNDFSEVPRSDWSY